MTDKPWLVYIDSYIDAFQVCEHGCEGMWVDMAETRLRAGVVGAGFVGMQHIDALHRLPGVELVALCEASPAKAQLVADQQGIPHAFSDWQQMLDSGLIDVVHNCTPNALHDPISDYALRRGIHLYCEKPLSTTYEGAQAIARLARAQGLAGGVNHNYRHNPMIHQMRGLLRAGQLGKVYMARGVYLQDWMMRTDKVNWRLDSGHGKARALADIGTHWMDLAQWVLGQPIVAVCADLQIAEPVRYRGDGTPIAIANEDSAALLVRFADSTPGHCFVSQVAGGHKNDLRLTLDCAAASVEWRQEEADRLVLGRATGGSEVLYADPAQLLPEAQALATLPAGHAVAWADALRNAISLFYASIREKTYRHEKQPYTTLEEGAYALRLINALIQSHQSRSWIDLT